MIHGNVKVTNDLVEVLISYKPVFECVVPSLAIALL